MAVKALSGAGTTNVKLGGGQLRSIFCASVASGTIQVKDGPDPSGNTQTLLGASALTPAGVGILFNPVTPLSFRDGLQVVIATGGEYEIQYD